jgi:dihydroxyacetone kinase DhaKLM complex PTS-EIIA-like component DhaM
MAKRIGADEMMVMQHLHIVQGKPGWSGQFLIATFNQCGRFTAMRFEWKGEQGGKDWACRAYSTEKATGEKICGAWVTWKMVEAEGWSKKSGSKWLTMPEQMFLYRSAAFLVRTHAPEIAMGLQTVEELVDVIDVTPSNGAGYAETTPGTKTEAIKQALKSKQAPEAVTDVVDTQAPTYAEIAAGINSAATTDDIDGALSVIHDGLPPEQQAELRDLGKARRLEVEGKQ